MRRSGRTSRIVSHVVDRLLANETVVANDHADYDHSIDSTQRFAKEVSKLYDSLKRNPKNKVAWKVFYTGKSYSNYRLIALRFHIEHIEE